MEKGSKISVIAITSASNREIKSVKNCKNVLKNCVKSNYQERYKMGVSSKEVSE